MDLPDHSLIIREKNISGKVGDFVRESVSKTGNFPLAPLEIILCTIFPIHVDSALLRGFIDKELCKFFCQLWWEFRWATLEFPSWISENQGRKLCYNFRSRFLRSKLNLTQSKIKVTLMKRILLSNWEFFDSRYGTSTKGLIIRFTVFTVSKNLKNKMSQNC